MDFIDLKSQQKLIKTKLDELMAGVLAHGQYVLGPEIRMMEERLAAYVGVKHCVSMASGTDALLLCMMALGIGRDDEVITPAFSFFAAAEMIALLGARPVFVDVLPGTCNLDPEKLEKAISPRTKAVIPVGLYGQVADMDAINEISLRHGLPVIEDAAQSFGATCKGRRSCGLSLVGCTSFFPAKPLGCYGDGGACFTNDEELATKLRQLRVHGDAGRYEHVSIGVNARMDTLQAAVILAKMDIFDDEVKSRARIGARYTELLKGVVETFQVEGDSTSVYAQYTIQVDSRDEFRDKMQKEGVPTAIHYPRPLHLLPVFSDLGYSAGDFPVSERLAGRVVSLPMHPYLSSEDQDRIVSAVKSAV